MKHDILISKPIDAIFRYDTEHRVTFEGGIPAVTTKQEVNLGMNRYPQRTTLGLKRSTKTRLDLHKAPGQCYDGFLCQLVNLWEETKTNKNRDDAKNRSL